MITVVVSNMIYLRGVTTPLRAKITKRLTIDNPEYVKRKKRRAPVWGVPPKIKLYYEDGTMLVLPRGFRGQLEDILNKENVTWGDHTIYGNSIDFGNWNEDGYAIRTAQRPCLDAVSVGNGVLIAPAGSGKTVMGLRYLWEKSRPALWITHTIDLLEQTTKRAYQCMPDIKEVGRIAEGKTVWGSGQLIVATYQTLMNNEALIEKLNGFIGTVVIDENHNAAADCFSSVINKLKAVERLGLTATPERKDGLESIVYATIGPQLYVIERNGLYDAGRLVKPTINPVYTTFNYNPASIVSEYGAIDAGGEEMVYSDLLQAVINDEERLQLIADNIVDCVGYQLVISDSIPYCHKLYDNIVSELINRGIHRETNVKVVHGTLQRTKWLTARSESDAMTQIQDGKAINAKYDAKARRWKVQVEQYDAQTFKAWSISTAERKQIMKDAADRKIDILIATSQLVQEGLDLPHLNHGHLVTPKRGDEGGKSNGIPIEQAIGRVMRPDPLNKDKQAFWWDYVDYNVGIFKNQFYSRKKVYERLGLGVPRKAGSKKQELSDFLKNLSF